MLDAVTGATEEQVRRDDRAHVFHSWSAQGLIDPLPIAAGAGVVLLGLRRQALPRLLQPAGQRQHRLPAPQGSSPRSRSRPARLTTISPAFANDARCEAARLIAELAPGDLNRVFFTNGGAEANENAMRMARLHTGRHKVLAAYRSYHGATAGSIALTGDPRRWPSEPGMPGVVRFWGPYLYRSRLPRRPPRQEECERALQHLRDILMVEGAAHRRRDHPRDGRRHQRHPRAAARLPRRACASSATSYGIVMIADEVMAGLRAAAASGSPSTTGASPPTSSPSPRASTPATSRSVASSSPSAIADSLRPAALPRRPDLLRPPARLRLRRRLHQRSSRRRASSSTPARSATDVIGPELRELADAPPDRRRGPRPRRVLGPRAGARPRDPRAAGAVQRRRRRRASR